MDAYDLYEWGVIDHAPYSGGMGQFSPSDFSLMQDNLLRVQAEVSGVGQQKWDKIYSDLQALPSPHKGKVPGSSISFTGFAWTQLQVQRALQSLIQIGVTGSSTLFKALATMVAPPVGAAMYYDSVSKLNAAKRVADDTRAMIRYAMTVIPPETKAEVAETLAKINANIAKSPPLSDPLVVGAETFANELANRAKNLGGGATDWLKWIAIGSAAIAGIYLLTFLKK